MRVTIDKMAWLGKDDLSLTQLQALRHELLVHPVKIGDYPGDPPEPIKLWQETETHIGVPREFFLERRKDRHEIELAYTMGGGLPSPLAFSGELRQEQTAALDKLVGVFSDPYCTGGLVRAAPGWGKTVFCCAVMAALGVPVLVIVHKEFLMNQWRERIEQFLPGAKIGQIQQDVCDIEGKHVVMAMVHSLASKPYPPATYQRFGFLITDECHRIGAETWSPVPAMFPARWRLGVSATPHRKDGADNVFKYHLGRILFSSFEQRMKVKVKRVWSDFKLIHTPNFNPNLAPRTLILKFLIASKQRNERIAGQITAAAAAGRKLLVLSERLTHLDELHRLVRERWGKDYPDQEQPTAGFYVGGRSEDEYKDASGAQIIFATKQYASEGLDIPALDTLVLSTPMGDVEQAVGRIQRPSPGKKDPIVVDIRDDNVKAFYVSGKSRDRFYLRVTE